MGKEPRDVRTRVRLSLLATVVGWAAAYLYFLLVQSLVWHRVTDRAAMLVWPALFAALGWIVAVLPISLFVKPESWLFAPSRAWAFGAVAGLAVFLALVGWWTPFWRSPWYLGFPIILGAVACWVYSRALIRLGLRAPSAA